MICFGHRGAMGYKVENTLESFEHAIELGVDAIEFDVYEIDNEFFVFHDRYLERLCGVEAYLTDKSAESIKTLKVHGKYKIPTLDEVISLIDNRVSINIELKNQTSDLFIDKLKELNDSSIIVSSFNHQELKKIKTKLPETKIGALHVALPVNNSKFAKELNSYSVHPSISTVTKEFVEDAHSNGLKVFVYTVNKKEDFLRMQEYGVDGLFTNYPDLMLEISNK